MRPNHRATPQTELLQTRGPKSMPQVLILYHIIIVLANVDHQDRYATVSPAMPRLTSPKEATTVSIRDSRAILGADIGDSPMGPIPY